MISFCDDLSIAYSSHHIACPFCMMSAIALSLLSAALVIDWEGETRSQMQEEKARRGARRRDPLLALCNPLEPLCIPHQQETAMPEPLLALCNPTWASSLCRTQQNKLIQHIQHMLQHMLP